MVNPPTRILDEVEADSAVWRKIKTHLESRLALKRAENDNSKSLEETEKLRGRIAEIKELMRIGDPMPQVEEQHPTY